MNSGDPSAGAESAAELLATLRRLCRDGKVELRIDAKRLDHMDSPVASEADGNIWAYAVVGLALGFWWWQGMAAALAALVLGIVAYLTLGRAYVHRRIERRVRERALESLETWRKLWRFKGLTLVADGHAGTAVCASPDDNWMAFVRKLR